MCVSSLGAQFTQPVDPAARSIFRQPQLGWAFAPMALTEDNSGRGVRLSAEYHLLHEWNGITEVTGYLPHGTPFTKVSGFRLRQDVVRYNVKREMYTGVSMMFKAQKIDHIAIVPIDDSTTYRKPYALIKRVLSPSFVIGTTGYFGEDSNWFIGGAIYLGVRYRNARIDGLTPTEEATMWPFDNESTDFVRNWTLKDGVNWYPELNLTLKIGYDFRWD